MDLVAIEEIKQLKARYCRYIDTKRWADWGTCLAADAVLIHPSEGLERLEGRDAIVGLVSEYLQDVVTVHVARMPEIELLGEDRARGAWSMFDRLVYPGTQGRGRATYEGYGYYLEQYVKEGDGHWRIAEINLVRTAVEIVTRRRDDDLASPFWS